VLPTTTVGTDFVHSPLRRCPSRSHSGICDSDEGDVWGDHQVRIALVLNGGRASSTRTGPTLTPTRSPVLSARKCETDERVGSSYTRATRKAHIPGTSSEGGHGMARPPAVAAGFDVIRRIARVLANRSSCEQLSVIGTFTIRCRRPVTARATPKSRGGSSTVSSSWTSCKPHLLTTTFTLAARFTPVVTAPNFIERHPEDSHDFAESL
jgi:hypothetical protein